MRYVRVFFFLLVHLAALSINGSTSYKNEPQKSTESAEQTALVKAAFDGDIETVQLLLEQGIDVNCRTRGDVAVRIGVSMALKDSIYGGYICGNAVMETYREVSEKDKVGVTPLMAAAAGGHEEIITILAEKGAPLDEKAYNGGSALMFAAMNDQIEAVNTLVSLKADVNAKDERGNTALMFAAWNGHVLPTVTLLEGGAEVNAKNDFGFTPLFGAVNKNLDAVAEVLLKKGADIEAQSVAGKTPLMYAADGGQVEMIKWLLGRGAEVNARDRNGRTPLMYAIRYKGLNAVRVLLENGADADATANNGVSTALLAAELNDYKEIAALLSERGARLSLDAELILAVDKGKTEIVKKLLSQGADANAKNSIGRTALMYAADEGHLDTVKALLDAGADVNIQDESGETALTEAAFEGHAAVVNLLVARGADVNARFEIRPHTPSTDSNGTTALMRAMIRGHLPVARILVSKGADVNLKNEEGETALSIARRFNHPNLVHWNLKYLRFWTFPKPMKKEYIKLSQSDQDFLVALLAKGLSSPRVFKRATALLQLHRGKTLTAVAQTLQVSSYTVSLWRDSYNTNRLAFLHDKPRSGRPPVIDGLQRAKVTALACSTPPDGRARWTLRLLADKVVELGYCDHLSHTQSRRILKKTNSNRT